MLKFKNRINPDNFLLSYEKQVYSQHGEDGIIETLTNAIKNKNKFFIELGYGYGDVNNSLYLSDKGWSGIGVDAKSNKYPLKENVDRKVSFITPDNLNELLEHSPNNPDFFSLDIDSFDYEIAEKYMSLGNRPKVVCAEINRKFGTELECSFPYVKDCRMYDKKNHHGVSFKKYNSFWESLGYKFYTLDTSHVNVFYYDPKEVDENLLPTEKLNWCIHSFQIPPVEFLKNLQEHEFWKKYFS